MFKGVKVIIHHPIHQMKIALLNAVIKIQIHALIHRQTPIPRQEKL